MNDSNESPPPKVYWSLAHTDIKCLILLNLNLLDLQILGRVNKSFYFVVQSLLAPDISCDREVVMNVRNIGAWDREKFDMQLQGPPSRTVTFIPSSSTQVPHFIAIQDALLHIICSSIRPSQYLRQSHSNPPVANVYSFFLPYYPLYLWRISSWDDGSRVLQTISPIKVVSRRAQCCQETSATNGQTLKSLPWDPSDRGQFWTLFETPSVDTWPDYGRTECQS